jgi:hypothetical protein
MAKKIMIQNLEMCLKADILYDVLYLAEFFTTTMSSWAKIFKLCIPLLPKSEQPVFLKRFLSKVFFICKANKHFSSIREINQT